MAKLTGNRYLVPGLSCSSRLDVQTASLLDVL